MTGAPTTHSAVDSPSKRVTPWKLFASKEIASWFGRATSDLAPDGKVFVRGEYWDASADDAVASGQPVEVTAVEGLRLRVRRSESEH